MSSKSLPDEERESLIAQYGLERVGRAADARESSEEDEPEAMYTEEEMMAMNAAQLSRSKTKRTLIPFIIAAVAIVLLVGLIIGIATLRNPGTALKGYSVVASDVSPSWSAGVLYNFTGSAQYAVHQLAGGIYVYMNPIESLWIFGRIIYTQYQPSQESVTKSSSALSLYTPPGGNMLTSAKAAWLADQDGYPRSFFRTTVPGDICQPSASTTVDDSIFLFWKFFHEGGSDSYAWGTGMLVQDFQVTATQAVQQDLLWDPEATIVVDNYIYVYFLHDSLYGDGQDELYVGRMPNNPTSFYNTARYMTYWNGRVFTSRPDKAVPIIDQFGKQTSIVYNSYLKKFLLLDPGYTNTLKIYESASPYRDWNAKPAVIYTNLNGDVGQAYFMQNLFEESGRIMYLSYVVKSAGDQVPHILQVKLLKRGN
jgi:hypothetical protein